jgi:hypothetical protein
MIREYKPEDLAAIERLHANPAYHMPNLDNPLMLIRRVLVDENDRPRMAAFGRLHVNALLFVDQSFGTPAERLEAIKLLQSDMIEHAAAMKLDIATTQMEGRFAERMQELGWVRGWGDLYYHDIPPHNSPRSL